MAMPKFLVLAEKGSTPDCMLNMLVTWVKGAKH
jgi:hypothetical protein